MRVLTSMAILTLLLAWMSSAADTKKYLDRAQQVREAPKTSAPTQP